GEELGMTNVRYDISEYRDIELLNFYKERIEQGYSQQEVMNSIYAKGRDNARTPMHWNASVNAGFSSGKPWIKINPNHVHINAEEQLERADSVFNYYRRLIELRKQYDVICYGDYELLVPENKQIFAYTRTYEDKKIRVICNFTQEPAINS
ncbi:MAG: glucohydrolase, partial [Lachnospiraceae bacterium]|nr:glucohydrolase [Lachnospiraceae bacterium]